MPVAIITRLLSPDRLYLRMSDKLTAFAYKLHGDLDTSALSVPCSVNKVKTI